MLDLFGIILSAFAEFLHLRGAPIDFVFDFLTFFVAYNGIRALCRSKIATVPVYGFFFSCKQFCRFTYITNICCRHVYRMNDSTVLVHPDMRFVPEMPVVSLLCLVCIRVALFLFILR